MRIEELKALPIGTKVIVTRLVISARGEQERDGIKKVLVRVPMYHKPDDLGVFIFTGYSYKKTGVIKYSSVSDPGIFKNIKSHFVIRVKKRLNSNDEFALPEDIELAKSNG